MKIIKAENAIVLGESWNQFKTPSATELAFQREPSKIQT